MVGLGTPQRVVHRPSTQPSRLAEKQRASAIVEGARNRLETSSYFHGRSEAIRLQARDGTLVLEGRVPSFYLKQMLQTILKDIEGVKVIDNRVEVFLPTGK